MSSHHRPLATVMALCATTVLLAGCGNTSIEIRLPGGDATNSDTHSNPEDSASAAAGALPVDLLPEPQEPGATCPYLDTEFVATTNGQRVTDVALDHRFDPPACLFWSYAETPQAIVLVRTEESEDTARGVIDWAAPVDLTEPAEEPEGFSGGRGSIGESGLDGYSVYAVQHASTSVVVFSDQAQTIKPQLIAEETIRALGL